MDKPWRDPIQLALFSEEAKQRYVADMDPAISRAKWHDTIDTIAAEFVQDLQAALGIPAAIFSRSDFR